MDKYDRLHLIERLDASTDSLHRGDANGAVQGAMGVLASYFDKQCARSRYAATLFDELQSNWPNGGVTLTYSSGLLIAYETQAFDLESAKLYVKFVSNYVSKSIPSSRKRLRIVQFIWDRATQLTREFSSITPANWYGMRSLLVSARLFCLRRTIEGENQYERSVTDITEILNESRKNAQAAYADFLAYRSFNTARNRFTNPAANQARRASIVWPDERDYVDFVRRDTRSRLLTTMHFGNFGDAGMRVGSHTPADRRVIALRNGDVLPSDIATKRHYEGRGIKYNYSINGERTPLNFLAALRKGNLTLCSLYDLNGDYGETVPVTFFGRTAYFVKGPVELAIIARIPIVAFVSYEEGGIDCIQMQDLIDTKLFRGEDLHNGVQRLTQQLVQLSEHWIRRYPHQWLYLQRLSSYFDDIRSIK